MIKEIRVKAKEIIAENGVEFSKMYSEKREKGKRTLKFYNLRYKNGASMLAAQTIAAQLQELYKNDVVIKITTQNSNDIGRLKTYCNAVSLRITAKE